MLFGAQNNLYLFILRSLGLKFNEEGHAAENNPGAQGDDGT